MEAMRRELREKMERMRRQVVVYLTCDEMRARKIQSEGITVTCGDLLMVPDSAFFEERNKCAFAWLSLEQAKRSQFGPVIFEVRINPEDAYVADLAAACDMFIVCNNVISHPEWHLESRCSTLVNSYRKSMQRLSEYLGIGRIKAEEVEVILTRSIQPQDITFAARR